MCRRTTERGGPLQEYFWAQRPSRPLAETIEAVSRIRVWRELADSTKNALLVLRRRVDAMSLRGHLEHGPSYTAEVAISVG